MSAEDSEGVRLVRALGFPLRRRILREMQGEEAISPLELSRRLEEGLSNVAYHVRILAECGAVALVGTRQARGSQEHFYRLAIEAEWVFEVLGLSPPSPSE